MENRKCLECYEQLRGRSDQKFCSDQCRSAYNNKLYNQSQSMINKINRILRKNYFILVSLFAEGRTTTTKSELQKKGYRFDYFTCSITTKSSHVNYFCYDQGYREQDNDKLTLMKKSQDEKQFFMHH